MAAFAASTSRIRLGQMCTCMGYRNPAYLAKVAATSTSISGGRVEMGIGGGWYEHEWRAYGYGFPAVARAARRLREGVEIMRQAWTTGTRHPRRRALPGRRRHRAAAAAAGGRHPALDRRRRREGHAARSRPSTPTTRTSPAPEEFDAQERDPARALRRDRARLRARSPARRTSTRSSARPRPRQRPARRGRRRDCCPFLGREARRRRSSTTTCDRDRVRHAGAGRRAARRRARARARLRDPLLPRGGLRPLRDRAVRARGHRRARAERSAVAGARAQDGAASERGRSRIRPRARRASSDRRRISASSPRFRRPRRQPGSPSRINATAEPCTASASPRGGASPAIAVTPSASRQSNQNGTSRQCTAHPRFGDAHANR